MTASSDHCGSLYIPYQEIYIIRRYITWKGNDVDLILESGSLKLLHFDLFSIVKWVGTRGDEPFLDTIPRIDYMILIWRWWPVTTVDSLKVVTERASSLLRQRAARMNKVLLALLVVIGEGCGEQEDEEDGQEA